MNISSLTHIYRSKVLLSKDNAGERSLRCFPSFLLSNGDRILFLSPISKDDGDEKDETKRKSRNLSEKKRRDEFNR